MSEEHVGKVYDTVADDYADHFPTTEPEAPIDLAMVAYFAALLAPTDGVVLDAGCGAGRMLPVLADNGCRPAGVDLSAGMIRRARQDHPDFETHVGSITALPFAHASFDGVFYWYSTIHTPDAELASVWAETRRVLRPEGYALVAFQVGTGTRDVAEGYRRLGHDVQLDRHDRTPDQVAAGLRANALVEVARLVRDPIGGERSAQAVIIARAAE